MWRRPFNAHFLSNMTQSYEKESSGEPTVLEMSDDLVWMAQQLQIPPTEDSGLYPLEVHFMTEKFMEMTELEAIEIVKKNMVYHSNDANFREPDRLLLTSLLDGLDGPTTTSNTPEEEDPDNKEFFDEKEDAARLKLIRFWATLFHWWSPYPEVRSVTDPYDDTECTTETWRVWVVGTIWVGISAFVNQFFSLRQPHITLTVSVCQLLLYPSGRLLQYCLPDKGFTFRGRRFTLNPGVWSQKEQLLATIMVSCASGTPYVTSNVLVQNLPMFYNQPWAGEYGYMFLLMLVTQYLGFGFGGLMKRVAVYPVKAMWPTLLPTLAVNKALLAPKRKEVIDGWSISRYTFFLSTFLFSFLYFWVPDYLMKFVSTFNWMTWIAPNNKDLAVVTGSVGGLGYNPISSFDWNVAVSRSQPIFLPLFSNLNTYIAGLISGLVILAVYYTNNNWTGYIPINSNRLFDNKGKAYDVKKILTDYKFDDKKYREYSPPYYSAGNLVSYGSSFAVYPLMFVYTILMEWRIMKEALVEMAMSLRHFNRSTYLGRDDPFSRRMRQYKEVPDWWFYLILLIMFGLSIALLEHWPMATPVWTLVFIIGLVGIFLVPLTIIQSYSGVQLSLNYLSELIIGYALPGQFMALNFTKAMGVQISTQAQNYANDQKLTHYAHLAPRSIFWLQLWATLVNGLICMGVIKFQITSIEDLCDPKNKDKFTCPGDTTFFNASVAWGIIGPKKMFGKQYPVLKWMFLLGALLAPAFYAVQELIPNLLKKKYPERTNQINNFKRKALLFNPILFCHGCIDWAPYNLAYKTTGIYVALFFNYYLKNRFMGWWKKYAFVFSAAMDTGIALSGIIIFFSVEYVRHDLKWWGNTVSNAGADNNGPPARLPIPEQGFFGPDSANYP